MKMKKMAKVSALLRAPVKMRRITLIILLLLMACCIADSCIVVPGTAEFFDLYEQVEEGDYIIASTFVASTQEECDRITNEFHIAAFYTEDEILNWRLKKMERLSKEPWCEKLPNGYRIIFSTTDVNIEHVMSWCIDNADMSGVLSITPDGIIKLPDGNYTWYPYDMGSFGKAIDGFEQYYIGRIETLQFPKVGITSNWRARWMGSIYYKLTARGLSIDQVYNLLYFSGLIPWIISLVINSYLIGKTVLDRKRRTNSLPAET